MSGRIQLIGKRIQSLRGPTANRPIVLTRPSNDDITQLSHYPGVRSDITPLESAGHVSQSQYKQQASESRIMTSRYPDKNMMRIIGSCLWAFSGGFSDAAPGALLPTIEAHYNISYSIVSLIWMSNAAGFILVAIFSHKIQPWFGKAKSIPLGCLSSILMYSIVASGGPFPLIVVGFFFGGIGLAIVLAQVNIFLSKLDKSSKYLSFFHGGYGLGATVSPFVATTMIEHNMHWNYVYIVNLGLMLINLVFLFFAFRGADTDLKPWDHSEENDRLIEPDQVTRVASATRTPSPEQDIGLQNLSENVTRAFESQNSHRDIDDDILPNARAPDTGSTRVPEISNPSTPTVAATQVQSAMRSALSNKLTWMISLYVLCYQGTEVALGGWIVSYLVDYRHTSASYGYVSSGFWGGLTLGRIILTRPLHKHLGARRSVNILVYFTLIFLVLTWVIPSDIVSGVFVSLAGVTIGPVYPMLITTVSAMLPRKIQVVSLTIMTAFGSSGGALIPFFVGLISQSAGTFVVLPVCITTYSLVLITWICLQMVGSRDQYLPLPRRFLAVIW